MNEQCIEAALNFYESYVENQYILRYLCSDPETLLSSKARKRIMESLNKSETEASKSIDGLISCAKGYWSSEYMVYLPRLTKIATDIQKYKCALEQDIDVKIDEFSLDTLNVMKKVALDFMPFGQTSEKETTTSSNSCHENTMTTKSSKKTRRTRKRNAKKNKKHPISNGKLEETEKEKSQEQTNPENIFSNLAKNSNTIIEQLKTQINNQNASSNEIPLKGFLGEALTLIGKSFNGENIDIDSIEKSTDLIKKSISNMMPGFDLESFFKKP